MTKPFNWGILATGRITQKFAGCIESVPDANLLAVGSRSQESADRFGDQFNISRRYSSYDALVNDPDVDAIYIGTPHPFHKDSALLCIEAGKPVLCEKPFTINASQARAVISAARDKGVFIMEAMWSRFLPMMGEVRRRVTTGEIGDIRMITSDFGFRTNVNPEGRLFALDMGGGGLLDVGVYPTSLVSMLLSQGGTVKPDRIASMAEIGETGVDEQAAAILGYPSGQMGIIQTGIRTSTPMETTIIGTDGRIRIHSPSWIATRMTIQRGGESEDVEIPFEGNGFNYQAAEVMRCVRAGKLESEIMPHAETIAVMEIMDEIRGQWGLKYPME
ncbi:MAG: Gfo/Idh/MocA family oxidoreductase [Chloroflexota bacterium]